MAIIQSGDFAFAFPTLILRRKLQDMDALNVRLRADILSLRAERAGITRSNVGAWHSELSFFASESAALGKLREVLRGAAREYWAMDQQRSAPGEDLIVRMTGWAMVYRRGDYAVPHVHPNSNFSGVYYVDGGDAALEHGKSGVLSCVDPRVGASGLDTGGFRHNTTVDIKPETGLLVLFPAWLLHHVHPYQGERERVAVSFNVSVHREKGIGAGG